MKFPPRKAMNRRTALPCSAHAKERPRSGLRRGLVFVCDPMEVKLNNFCHAADEPGTPILRSKGERLPRD